MKVKNFHFKFQDLKLYVSVSPKSGYSSLIIFSQNIDSNANISLANAFSDPEWITLFVIREPCSRFLSGYLNKVVGISHPNKVCRANTSLKEAVEWLETKKCDNIIKKGAFAGGKIESNVHFQAQCPDNVEKFDHIISVKNMFPFIQNLAEKKGVTIPKLKIINNSEYGEDMEDALSMRLEDFQKRGIPSKKSFLTPDICERIKSVYRRDNEIYEKYVLSK